MPRSARIYCWIWVFWWLRILFLRRKSWICWTIGTRMVRFSLWALKRNVLEDVSFTMVLSCPRRRKVPVSRRWVWSPARWGPCLQWWNIWSCSHDCEKQPKNWPRQRTAWLLTKCTWIIMTHPLTVTLIFTMIINPAWWVRLQEWVWDRVANSNWNLCGRKMLCTLNCQIVPFSSWVAWAGGTCSMPFHNSKLIDSPWPFAQLTGPVAEHISGRGHGKSSL